MRPFQKNLPFQLAQLGSWETPLEPMLRLRQILGGDSVCPRLWIKREDLTGLAGGGNKVRKLEAVMGHAISLGADTVINTGGVQSNQARQTAGAAARLGLECHLVLFRPKTHLSDVYELNGNIMICRILGAKIHIIDETDNYDEAMSNLAIELKKIGKKPYIIPMGASTKEASLGPARLGEEICSQALQFGFTPDWIVSTVGSGGTCAGVYSAVYSIYNDIDNSFTKKPKIIGVDIIGPDNPVNAKDRLLSNIADCCELLDIHCPKDFVLFNELSNRLGIDKETCAIPLVLSLSYAGKGYGKPYKQMVDTLTLVARSEGVLLDPVYTGKTMTALIAGINNKFFSPDEDVIFLHSGGQYSLFAYPELFNNQ